MENPYSEYISEILPHLFQGSWHSSNSNIIDFYQIDKIVHIGFEPIVKKDKSDYEGIMIDDNSQNAHSFIQEIIPDLISRCKLEIDKGKRVLICCSAGRSRSIAVVMAYLMKYNELSRDESLEYIKTKRPYANPNPGFLRELQHLAAKKKMYSAE